MFVTQNSFSSKVYKYKALLCIRENKSIIEFLSSLRHLDILLRGVVEHVVVHPVQLVQPQHLVATIRI